jgi:hypothetical protein
LLPKFDNNSLGVVDLAAGKVLRTIAGLREPEGVAYVSFADSVLCGECWRRLAADVARLGSDAHRAHRDWRRCR